MNFFKSREGGNDKSKERGSDTPNTTRKTIRKLGCAALIIAAMTGCKPNLKKMSLPELQGYLYDLTSKINDGADVQGLIAGEHNIGIDEDNGKDREQVDIILQGTSNRGKENTKDFNEALNEINRVRKEIDKRMANGEGGGSNHQYMDPDALDNARNIINKQQEFRDNTGKGSSQGKPQEKPQKKPQEGSMLTRGMDD